jgi:hypothetical protein
VISGLQINSPNQVPAEGVQLREVFGGKNKTETQAWIFKKSLLARMYKWIESFWSSKPEIVVPAEESFSFAEAAKLPKKLDFASKTFDKVFGDCQMFDLLNSLSKETPTENPSQAMSQAEHQGDMFAQWR